EYFVGRENDEIGGGKTKAAARCPLKQVDASQCVGRNDLAKTFDLALGLKIDRDGCVYGAPLRQPGDELRPLRFCEHEIADGEFTDVAFDKRTGKIFRRRVVVFDPAFANLNVAWTGWLRRARPHGSSAQCGLEFD